MSLKKTVDKEKQSFCVALILIVFCLIIQVRSGQFFTPNNIVTFSVHWTIP